MKPKKRQKLQYPNELPYWKGLRFFPDDNRKVRKTDSWGDERRVAKTFELLTYLKNNRHPTIVTILDCRKISSTEYSYDMPLMAELSNSETELVDLVTSGEYNPDYRIANRHRVYRLRKKHPKLFQVIQKINSWKTYVDLHEGNLMKDQYGNYKLIDLEGFGFTRYSSDDIISSITAKR
jgi:hypothetical protein